MRDRRLGSLRNNGAEAKGTFANVCVILQGVRFGGVMSITRERNWAVRCERSAQLWLNAKVSWMASGCK